MRTELYRLAFNPYWVVLSGIDWLLTVYGFASEAYWVVFSGCMLAFNLYGLAFNPYFGETVPKQATVALIGRIQCVQSCIDLHSIPIEWSWVVLTGYWPCMELHSSPIEWYSVGACLHSTCIQSLLSGIDWLLTVYGVASEAYSVVFSGCMLAFNLYGLAFNPYWSETEQKQATVALIGRIQCVQSLIQTGVNSISIPIVYR